MTNRIQQAKAHASDVRWNILQWLKEPLLYFSHQTVGDPVKNGVCVTLIAEKLKMSQPTVSRHLELLHRAKFIKITRIGRWSYISRYEVGIKNYRNWMNEKL